MSVTTYDFVDVFSEKRALSAFRTFVYEFHADDLIDFIERVCHVTQ